jgi:hypothetical protein
MPKLIFDIETIGEDFDSLDETTQEVLTRWLEKESVSESDYAVGLEELKSGLGFSPLTGEIVAIGVLDYDTKQGAVYFQAPGEKDQELTEEGIKFKSMSEPEMLKRFWEVAVRYDEFISFNGRTFDAPFLMIRSAVHGLTPTKNLMTNRYLNSQKYDSAHIDLLDQFTFYGAMRRKGNLHLWCRAFGLESPKAQGVTGDDVGQLFREKKFLDIARYNAGDLRATGGLYERWLKHFRI